MSTYLKKRRVKALHEEDVPSYTKKKEKVPTEKVFDTYISHGTTVSIWTCVYYSTNPNKI